MVLSLLGKAVPAGEIAVMGNVKTEGFYHRLPVPGKFIDDVLIDIPGKEHPLHGKNIDELGPRFPAMVDAYSPRLIQMARDIAKEKGIRLMEGVYVGTQGPTFETPAEYRYFWRIGGDAVGMSTVPEVIVARHGDMEVFGISIITDLGVEGAVEKASHEEVQKAAAAAQPIMAMLVREMIDRFDEL